MSARAGGLDYELTVPDGVRDGAPVAVLLHGRGSDRHDLGGLAPHLAEGTVVVTPEAPHPAGPWGYGRGWAWYRYVAEDRLVGETLEHSLGLLDAFLDELAGILPVAGGPVVLGGFSQGGTTSLAYALTRPGRVDGVAVLSGFLADVPEVPLPAEGPVLPETPVFWGHGTDDPSIPHALGVRGRSKLLALGARLTAHDYPMGHMVSRDELADLARWMEGEVIGR